MWRRLDPLSVRARCPKSLGVYSFDLSLNWLFISFESITQSSVPKLLLFLHPLVDPDDGVSLYVLDVIIIILLAWME